MVKSTHYNFIDVSKAVASFFIVMVHVITPRNYYACKLAQIGAMALFFFASGFLFKDSYVDLPFKDFVKKFAKKCLIPYFIGAVFGFIICKLFPSWYGHLSTKDILISIFISGGPHAFGAVWYLMCLFFIEIMFYTFMYFIKTLKPELKVFYIMLFMLAFFCIAKVVNKYYQLPIFIKIPLKIDSAFTGIIYFTMGYLFKYLEFYKYLGNKILCISIFFVTKILSLYLEHNYLGYSNICDCRYDIYNLYFFIQILGIASFISIGAIFSDIKLLQWLGKNNLLIYLLHVYVLWIIEEIYGRIIGDLKYEFYDIKEILFMTILTYVLTALLTKYLIKGTFQNTLKEYKERGVKWLTKIIKN